MFENNKITETEWKDKGIVGIPVVPKYDTATMQRKHDEKSDFFADKYNGFVDSLGENITNIVGQTELLPTSEAVVKALQTHHYGNMKKAVYDTNNDGMVDTTKDAMPVNVLSFPYALGFYESKNGLTCEVSPDGEITINGTATADTDFNLCNATNPMYLKFGNTYTLIPNCNQTEWSSTFFMQLYDTSWTQRFYLNFGYTHEITTTNPFYCRVHIINGQVINNLKFKPMFVLGNGNVEYTKPLSGGMSATLFSLQQKCYRMDGGTISAGATSKTFSDSRIKTGQSFIVFVDDMDAYYDAKPTLSVSNGSLTINFATALSKNIRIKKILERG